MIEVNAWVFGFFFGLTCLHLVGKVMMVLFHFRTLRRIRESTTHSDEMVAGLLGEVSNLLEITKDWAKSARTNTIDTGVAVHKMTDEQLSRNEIVKVIEKVPEITAELVVEKIKEEPEKTP